MWPANRPTPGWQSAKTGKTFTGEGLAELAREGMENFVAAQKKFLDVVAEEAAKAAKPRHGDHKAEKPTELAELARQSVDAFIEAQKRLLDTAGEQMRVNMKAAGRTMNLFTPVPGANLADMTRQGVESFVAAQKALLDVMTTPRAAAGRASSGGSSARTRESSSGEQARARSLSLQWGKALT